MSFDFLSAIKNVAPFIAGTFGTPLVGMAVKAICSQLPDDQATAVQDAHADNPDTGALGKLGELFQQGAINIATIKQAELDHARMMAELGYKSATDLAQLQNADRADARARDTALVTATGKTNRRADILAYGALLAFVAAGYALFAFELPAANRELIVYLLGALTVIVKDIYGFEFSTTRDSQAKTGALVDMAKAPPGN